ncbi:MAG: histidine kinase, partial [Cytophagaceae bacterium]|nr:histidine kinase [Cytophagaceae bacterium]
MRLSRLILFILLPGWLPAQYPVRHLTPRDGLSMSAVQSLLRDSRGFLWAGTENGLNRFEGRRFQRYRASPTDSSTMGGDAVLGMVEVPSGDLWIGSGECLNRYDRRRDAFERVYALNPRGRKTPTPNAVIGTDGASVWYLNGTEGLMAYHIRERRKEQLLPPRQLPVAYLNGAYRPTGRDLFIALKQGMLRFELRTRRVTHFFTTRPDDQVGAPQEIFRAFFSRNGTGWLPTRKGLIRFSPEEPGNAHLVPLPRLDPRLTWVEAVDEDTRGRIWLGTLREGILILDPTSERVTENIRMGEASANSLASNRVKLIYLDQTGLAWVNVFPLGIDVLFPKLSQIRRLSVRQIYPKDSVHQFLGQLAEDPQGRIWMATAGAGPRWFDPRTGATGGFRAVDWWPKIGMMPLIFDQHGRLWAGSRIGVWVFEPGQAASRLIPTREPVRSFLELPDHSLLFVTQYGIHHLAPPFGTYQTLPDSGNFAGHGLLHFNAARRLIYVSKDEGGFRCYRYEGGRFRRLSDVPMDFGITAFYWDSLRGCLWLGTDRGLVQFDPVQQKQKRHFPPSGDLSGSCVTGILPDHAGFLWLSTCLGLVRFDPRTGQFYPIPATAGRTYSYLSAWRASDGMLYFGTTEELDYFVPETLRKAPPPRLHFTGLRLDDRPARPATSLTETRELVLGPDQNTFTLEFAALDYFSEEPTNYQYRLVGQGVNWTLPGPENTARYARVPPGQYTFEVRALDWRGEWTPVRHLPVVVKPHFWQTAWFIFLMSLGLVAAVFMAFRLYLRARLQSQQRLTSRIVAAQEDERRRIARDLHDDLGNTLAAAKGLLGRLDETLAKQPQIQEVTSIISQASDDIRAITHDLMPVEFERYALGDTLRLLVEKTRASSAITFEFVQAGPERKLPPERELIIYRIASELITNVLKHSKAKLAVLQLMYQPNSLVLSLEDDGIGDRSLTNPPEKLGIGLKNITSRCQYLTARLTYQADASGTLVLIEIPDA